MNNLFPKEIINDSPEKYFGGEYTSAKVIYWCILSFVLLMLFSLPLISVDISTQSMGVVRATSEDSPIQSAIYGKVVLVKLAENLLVKQGDTLLQISTEKADEQVHYHQIEMAEEYTHLADLSLLLSKKYAEIETPLFKQEYRKFKGQLDEQNVKLQQSLKEFRIAAGLFEKKVIARREYETKKENYEYELNRLNNITEEQQSDWQNRYSNLKIEIEGLKSNVVQLEKEKQFYTITAPVSGSITRYSGIREGSIIAPNQILASVSPNDSLQVECFVSPSDIGLIEVGMNVVFQIHAYNYNQWGMLNGKVHEISNSVVEMGEKPYFRVRCLLNQNYLSLENGYRGYLKKGMTLTGRFKIANRSLFHLLYDKADKWLNPKNDIG